VLLVTFTRIWREKSQFSGFPVLFLGVVGGVALDRDVWPFGRVFGVEFQPALEAGLRVGLDGFGRAFRFADATVDAFIGVNDQHVFAFIEAIHRADFHAVHVFALYAVLGDDVSHCRSFQSGLERCPSRGWDWLHLLFQHR
jgi:acylphosphatase